MTCCQSAPRRRSSPKAFSATARAIISSTCCPEDNEQTIDEVRARIRKTVDFAESVKEVQYAGRQRAQD
jgi:hypothetical protein